jgi:hypothetical protein
MAKADETFESINTDLEAGFEILASPIPSLSASWARD